MAFAGCALRLVTYLFYLVSKGVLAQAIGVLGRAFVGFILIDNQ
jgi:hypothetical protein